MAPAPPLNAGLTYNCVLGGDAECKGGPELTLAFCPATFFRIRSAKQLIEFTNGTQTRSYDDHIAVSSGVMTAILSGGIVAGTFEGL
jgi:hypothetical protein